MPDNKEKDEQRSRSADRRVAGATMPAAAASAAPSLWDVMALLSKMSIQLESVERKVDRIDGIEAKVDSCAASVAEMKTDVDKLNDRVTAIEKNNIQNDNNQAAASTPGSWASGAAAAPAASSSGYGLGHTCIFRSTQDQLSIPASDPSTGSVGDVDSANPSSSSEQEVGSTESAVRPGGVDFESLSADAYKRAVNATKEVGKLQSFQHLACSVLDVFQFGNPMDKTNRLRQLATAYTRTYEFANANRSTCSGEQTFAAMARAWRDALVCQNAHVVGIQLRDDFYSSLEAAIGEPFQELDYHSQIGQAYRQLFGHMDGAFESKAAEQKKTRRKRNRKSKAENSCTEVEAEPEPTSIDATMTSVSTGLDAAVARNLHCSFEIKNTFIHVDDHSERASSYQRGARESCPGRLGYVPTMDKGVARLVPIVGMECDLGSVADLQHSSLYDIASRCNDIANPSELSPASFDGNAAFLRSCQPCVQCIGFADPHGHTDPSGDYYCEECWRHFMEEQSKKRGQQYDAMPSDMAAASVAISYCEQDPIMTSSADLQETQITAVPMHYLDAAANVSERCSACLIAFGDIFCIWREAPRYPRGILNKLCSVSNLRSLVASATCEFVPRGGGIYVEEVDFHVNATLTCQVAVIYATTPDPLLKDGEDGENRLKQELAEKVANTLRFAYKQGRRNLAICCRFNGLPYPVVAATFKDVLQGAELSNAFESVTFCFSTSTFESVTFDPDCLDAFQTEFASTCL